MCSPGQEAMPSQGHSNPSPAEVSAATSKPPRVNRSKNGLRDICPPTRLPDAAFSFSCSFSDPQLWDLPPPLPHLLLLRVQGNIVRISSHGTPLSHTSPCSQYILLFPTLTLSQMNMSEVPASPASSFPASCWPHPCPKARNISGQFQGFHLDSWDSEADAQLLYHSLPNSPHP